MDSNSPDLTNLPPVDLGLESLPPVDLQGLPPVDLDTPTEPDASLDPDTLPDLSAELEAGTPSAAPVGEEQSFMDKAAAVAADIGGGILEAPKQALGGVLEATGEVARTLENNLASLGSIVWDDDGIRYEPGQFEKLTVEKGETVTGGLVRGGVQFATGFIPAMRGLKAVGMTNTIARALTAGAVTDAVAFDPFQERLSNLASEQDSPLLNNIVTQALASTDDDTEWEGRLKNAVEGGVIGGAVEGIVRAVKAAKQWDRFKPKVGEGQAVEAPPVPPEAVTAGQKVAFLREHLDELKRVDESLQAIPQAEATRAAVKEQAEEVASKLKEAETALDEVKQTDAYKAVPAALKEELEALTTAPAEQAKGLSLGTPGRLTDDQVTNLREALSRAHAEGLPVDEAVKGIDFNFTYNSSPEQVKSVINQMSQVAREAIDQGRGGEVKTWEATEELARQLGESPQALVESLSRTFGSTQDLDSLIVASKIYNNSLAQQVERLSLLADKNPTDKLVIAELSTVLKHMADVQVMLKGVGTNVARAQNAQKIVTGANGKGLDDSTLRLLVENQDDPNAVRAIARRLRLSGGNPSVVAKGVGEKGKSGFWDYHNEYLINAMLSGPKTHAVNFVSNFVQSLNAPLEMAVGGVFGRNTAQVKEAANIITGEVLAMRDALRLAVKAFKVEENILDAPHSLDEFTGKHIGMQPDSTEFTRALGVTVRLPGRLLLSSDELFKQMHYRARVRAQALREADELGLSGTEKANHVENVLASSFDDAGKGLNESALQYARETTFTQSLEYGAGKTLQDAVQKHPGGRIIFPFIRTPTNIFRAAWQRFPGLGMIQRQMREDIAAGGQRRANALAKQALGMGLYSYAASLAFNGQITGAPPKDPNLRQMMYDSGWRPYSFRVEDGTHPNGEPRYKYIEYRRMDPQATPLAIMSEVSGTLTDVAQKAGVDVEGKEFFPVIADLVQASGELSSKEYEEAAAAVAAAMAKAVTSKTFLQGSVQMMDAVTSGEEYKVRSLGRSLVSAYVPNFLNQVNPDPTVRELRALGDAVLAKVPGYSEELPPRRNLFGEPSLKTPGLFQRALNPFAMSREVDDVTYKRLIELGKSLPMPPKTMANGAVDLTDPRWADPNGKLPYDAWLEELNRGDFGYSFKKELIDLIQSGDWETYELGTKENPDGPRYQEANRLRMYWQDQAWRSLMDKPELQRLRDAIDAEKDKQRMMKRFGAEGATLMDAVGR